MDPMYRSLDGNKDVDRGSPGPDGFHYRHQLRRSFGPPSGPSGSTSWLQWSNYGECGNGVWGWSISQVQNVELRSRAGLERSRPKVASADRNGDSVRAIVRNYCEAACSDFSDISSQARGRRLVEPACSDSAYDTSRTRINPSSLKSTIPHGTMSPHKKSLP